MARVKKAIDYIKELCSSKTEAKRKLGKALKAQHRKWIRTLVLKDFLEFDETIMTNKAEIGVAQFFGKFRAYAFEEYVYRLLKEKVHIRPLELFWGEKCLVWRGAKESYGMEFDISVGRKIDGFVCPTIVFEIKIELDSSRLKTALASFAILKNWNPKVNCVIVYMTRELDSNLLGLAKNWADGIFQFSTHNNATAAFLTYVAKRV
ncbi:MAG: hypothetical protein QXX79_00990 [Candidatus Bathyarchaeia archaeon]